MLALARSRLPGPSAAEARGLLPNPRAAVAASTEVLAVEVQAGARLLDAVQTGDPPGALARKVLEADVQVLPEILELCWTGAARACA